MTTLFPAPADWPPPDRYASVDGEWLRTSASWPGSEGEVRLTFATVETWEVFRSGFERQRFWKRTVGVVMVDQAAVEEIVTVARRGRYRGAGVFLMGHGSHEDGMVAVGLASEDRVVAADLGFDGDERFQGFNKRVPHADVTDLQDEVRVRWRRGVGRV